MKALDNLTGVRYERLRLGIWAAAEGLVYEDYNPSVHIYKQIKEPPADWTRFLSIDFGFTNPFVCQFWAIDNDGRAYLYKEIYKTRTLVEDHAAQIKELLRNEPRIQYIITDHDAEDRATLERHLGMSTTKANKNVSEGIQSVAARLKVQADGKPRIYLCRDAVVERDSMLENEKKPCSTLEETAGYVWNTDKDAPVKTNDHGMDAMRYLVAHLDIRDVPTLRTFNF
jgi:phage terminase large subunit